MIRLNDTLNQTCAIAIQDDWKTWNKNGEISDAGKPLYIDNSDHSTQHIFFDDNADEQVFIKYLYIYETRRHLEMIIALLMRGIL